MAYEVKLQLKQTQKLVMTTELRQAIQLLTLSRLELQQTIKEKLLDNPLLEEVPEPVSEDIPSIDLTNASPAEKGAEDGSRNGDNSEPLKEVNWEEFLQSYQENAGYNLSSDFSEEAPNLENMIAAKETLSEHLHKQLALVVSNDEESKIGSLIIGNINENGLLSMSLEEMAQRYEIDLDRLRSVHRLFRDFVPEGVAAENLQQCLMIQLENRGMKDSPAYEILKNHMDELTTLNIRRISESTGISEGEVKKALKVIRELDPKPARNFGGDEIRYIIPDVYVVKVDDDFVVYLNEEGLNNIRISQSYKKMISKMKLHDDETKEYIEQKMRSALWLLKTIQQRQRTIYKVAKSIVEKQRPFFEKGISHLKPMILKEIADDVDLHECTVSRVTSNKYMHTPHGIFELKFFFSSGIVANNGDSISSESIKERIRNIIQSEDKTKPYSDEKIVQILAKDNIFVARRTVAKYREELNFLPSSKRKKIV
ncbi:MAG: RNA polymerase sigma-54 factor [Candidatus Schekmanbacteria bacterium]|nr:MAG: RNA polymerase sigma-54 factor [Candidatus Schekmanbacteria bacterium]